jgi:NADH-quinone oxidoreductase subunit L
VIGSAALAALPFTSGFYSKDAILLSAYENAWQGPLLWGIGLLGALLTSIYSFRLVFVVFFGEVKTEPSQPAGWLMTAPLLVLCLLALLGGSIVIPVMEVFPAATVTVHDGLIAIITPSVPILGVLIAYLIFLSHSVDISVWTDSKIGKALNRFWFSHWAMDWLYDTIIVKPYAWIAHINRMDIVDWFYNFTADVIRLLHDLATQSQTGQLRTYAGVMVLGLAAITAIVLLSGGGTAP